MSLVRDPQYMYSEKILNKSKMDLLINKMNILQELKRKSQKGYPCIEFNPEGYITYIKSEFVSFLGYEKTDFEGLHFSDFFKFKSSTITITPEVWNKVLSGEIIFIDFNINTKFKDKLNVNSFFESVTNQKGIPYKVSLKISKW